MAALPALTGPAAASAQPVAELTYTVPTLNADNEFVVECTLTLKRYWDPAYAGPRKALLHIDGNGWAPIDPLRAADTLVQQFTARGYAVYSASIRGWAVGGGARCLGADRAQQDRDYQSIFTRVLLDYGFYDLAGHGIVLSGYSAGGHRAMFFGREATPSYQSLIRAVIAVDSPLSVWHYWANNNGFYAPSYFEPRDISVPGPWSSRFRFPLVAGDRSLNLPLEGYFRNGLDIGVDCNFWFQTGPACFSGRSPAVWDYIFENSPLADSPAFPPVLMLASTDDQIVYADSIFAVCESFGKPLFVANDAIRYVADCGTGGERFLLRKSGGHVGGLAGVLPDIVDWLEAQPYPR